MSLLRATSVAAITALAIAAGCATTATGSEPPVAPTLHPLAIGGGPAPEASNPVARTARWDQSLADFGPSTGDRLAFVCGPRAATRGLSEAPVKGSDVYADDSSICAAAVHAGKIKPETGGTVTLEVIEGRPHYDGSLRNGIDSTSYGSSGRSFVFR
ncbi:MAG: LCCL domain-containing protein [Polyangiales bacterium]